MTLCTADNHTLRISRNYLLTALFLAFFGAVYEHFSHQVYSYFMIYAFAIPLVLGALPYLLSALHNKPVPSAHTTQLYAGGVMMLTMASILRGVLDIYGTTNAKLIILPIAGLCLILGSALFRVLKVGATNCVDCAPNSIMPKTTGTDAE